MPCFKPKMTFTFGFSGWRTISFETSHTAKPFRCPECGVDVFPQNVMDISCANCGQGGNKQHFSAVLKRAA
jgi:hypothetical protein